MFFNKISKFALGLFLIVNCVSFIPNIISSSSGSEGQIFVKKEPHILEVELNDFSGFQLSEDHANISSTKSDNLITFQNEESNDYIATEKFRLDLSRYEYTADCEFSIKFRYTSPSISKIGFFGLEIFTNYSFTEKEYTSNQYSFAKFQIYNSFSNNTDLRISCRDYTKREGIYDYNNIFFQNDETYVIKFLKESNEVEMKILDINGQILTSESWHSSDFYANVHSLELFYIAIDDDDFVVTASEFSGILELDYRNVQALKIRDIIGVVLGIIAVLLILGTVGYLFLKNRGYFGMRSRRRHRAELDNKFSLWNAKNTSERIVILKGLLFEGEINKNAKCGVCKLDLKSKKDILHCPNCKTLFHKDHLIDWLEQKNNCPICQKPLLE